MKFKKILLLLIISAMAVTAVGCTKKADDQATRQTGSKILLEATAVDKAVRGWSVYTNSQFRYELRHPKSWVYSTDNEGEKIVVFHPKNKSLSDDYVGEVIVHGIVNWQQYLSLPEYYATKAVNNYYTLGFENEKVTINGVEGIWFKDVENLYKDKKIQILAFDLKDRILEIHLIDMTNEEALAVVNSLKFYGNSSVTIDQ